MKDWMKENWLLLFAAAATLIVLVYSPGTCQKALCFSGNNLLLFLLRLPPVFIFTGLLDVWIDRERMMRLMGEGSGRKGSLVSLLLGVLTAVPLYALLPVVGILLKKRCRIFNVLLFLCSSASIRLPLLLFEAASLGWKFTLVRCALNLLVVFAIPALIDLLLSKEEKQAVFDRADTF